MLEETFKEEEEFLYPEDFERVEKKLVDDFTKNDLEPMIDGNDYIKPPKTKREFISMLKAGRNGLVRKDEDCQRGYGPKR